MKGKAHVTDLEMFDIKFHIRNNKNKKNTDIFCYTDTAVWDNFSTSLLGIRKISLDFAKIFTPEDDVESKTFVYILTFKSNH